MSDNTEQTRKMWEELARTHGITGSYQEQLDRAEEEKEKNPVKNIPYEELDGE